MTTDQPRHRFGPVERTRRTRATRAFVATGSLIAIIVIGIPWVDEYLQLRREVAEHDQLQVQLSQSQARKNQLDRIESRIAGELEAGSARTTDPRNKQLVRERLIEFVRESGGRVRRLEIEIGQTRPWAASGDDPHSDSLPLGEPESRFLLYTHNLELRAEGTLASVQRILHGIASHGWLMTTESMTVMPSGSPEAPVKLEIQLILYGLEFADRLLDDEFASNYGNRLLI